LGVKSTYLHFIEQEGIPVHNGFFVKDIGKVELAPWSRMGGRGAYKLPTMRDIALHHTILVSGATEGPGPFNAKPAAEHAITPVPPAVANAVFDATGVRLTSLPISCEKVYQGLQRKQ